MTLFLSHLKPFQIALSDLVRGGKVIEQGIVKVPTSTFQTFGPIATLVQT